MLHFKELEKEQIKSNISRRKEAIKIRSEVNEIETKKEKQQKGSMKLRAGSSKR